jgi:hypothetical protein
MKVPTMTPIRWFALLALIVSAGCSGSGGPQAKPAGVAVRGKVLLPSGSPLAGGTLVLRPVAGLHGASAQIQKDGTFELASPDGSQTVVPGQYQVFVRFNNPDQKSLKTAVNARYQNSEDGDSDVVVDIQGAQDALVIRLKR